MEYVRQKYPEKYADMISALTSIQKAVRSEVSGMDALIKGYSNSDEEQHEV
jgi:hypothetical protein